MLVPRPKTTGGDERAMRLTVTNQEMGTSTRLNVPPSGIISKRTAFLCRQRLKCPPGSGGPLGESGEQWPPEFDGKVRYEIRLLEDLRVEMRPVSMPGVQRESKRLRSLER